MSALAKGFALALVFSAVAAHAGDRSKPAKRYALTPIVATNNAPCEPGFTQNTFTRRMNESGQVIGYHECWEATGDPARPFLLNAGWGYLWTPGTGSVLLPNIAADGIGTFGRAVNELGIAVGWEFTPTALNAPIWFPGGGADYIVRPLCTSGFTVAQADDINDHNSVAASATRASCGLRNWILRLADGTEFLGPLGSRPSALNNNDLLVGQQVNDAIKWSPALGTVVLQAGTPFERAQAWNLNDRNEVVGEWNHSASNDQCVTTRDAMYWSPTGAGRVLANLRHDTHGTALGINDHGLVVGYSETFASCNEFVPDRRRAVIWHQGRVIDLNTLLKRSDARAIQLINASAISNRGQIAVSGFYRNQPLTRCPNLTLDPDTGAEIYNDTLQCRSIYAFLLTPDGDN
jgi:hypothetical protein